MVAYFRPDLMSIDTPTRRKEISARVALLVAKINSDKEREESLKQLILIAKGRYEYGAMKATIGIGDLGENAIPVLDVLGDQLFGGGYISREAGFSLSRLGAIAKSQLPKLEKAADDLSFEANYAVYEAIGDMGADAAYLIPKLRRHLGMPHNIHNQYRLNEAIRKLEEFEK